MGWHEDHRNTVAARWAKKYHESGMTAEKFSEYMRNFMLKGGWSESDTEKMIARAIGNGGKATQP